MENLPIWKPSRRVKTILDDGMCEKERFKAFRNSSSSFIKNKEVRNYILIKSNFCCVYCNSKNDLEVDHINSVLFCFKNSKFYECNNYENLQILCKKCNAGKLP